MPSRRCARADRGAGSSARKIRADIDGSDGHLDAHRGCHPLTDDRLRSASSWRCDGWVLHRYCREVRRVAPMQARFGIGADVAEKAVVRLIPTQTRLLTSPTETSSTTASRQISSRMVPRLRPQIQQQAPEAAPRLSYLPAWWRNACRYCYPQRCKRFLHLRTLQRRIRVGWHRPQRAFDASQSPTFRVAP